MGGLHPPRPDESGKLCELRRTATSRKKRQKEALLLLFLWRKR